MQLIKVFSKLLTETVRIRYFLRYEHLNNIIFMSRLSISKMCLFHAGKTAVLEHA